MNTLNNIILWFYRICAGIVTVKCAGHLIRVNHTSITQINWNPTLINVLYKLIYFYSKVQLLCVKLNTKLFAVLLIISDNSTKILRKYNISVKPLSLHQFDFYNNGNLIGSKTFNNELKLTIDVDLKQELENMFSKQYNFIIYSDLSNLNKEYSINKVLYQVIPDEIYYQVSNVKFIGLILFYQDADIHINLSTNEYNFYVVNNIFDKYFIIYFIKNILKNQCIDTKNIFQYKLTLYDQNAEIKTLDESDTIVLHKDTYEIVKCDKQISSDGFVIT
uniref:Uncharacterized protein n=1 Tax=viral metagenome TaxID=1070528 RepID=A0A6C0E160_9ZZZZ